MLGFFKKLLRSKEQSELSAQQQHALRELQAAKDRITPKILDVLDYWRVNRLEGSRVMADEHFAERLVGLEADDVHSFETLAKIEAIALLIEWDSASSDRVHEFSSLLDAEAHEFIDIMEIGAKIECQLEAEIAEARTQLGISIDTTITEESQRRWGIP
jgi:hypothetical protein